MLGDTDMEGWKKERGAVKDTEKTISQDLKTETRRKMVDKGETVSENCEWQALVKTCCMLSSFFFQLDKSHSASPSLPCRLCMADGVRGEVIYFSSRAVPC